MDYIWYILIALRNNSVRLYNNMIILYIISLENRW